MKSTVYICGNKGTPTTIGRNKDLTVKIIDSPYDLRDCLEKDQGEKVIVTYLPFLEMRHLELYGFLQKGSPNIQTIFIVDELSSSMKIHLKTNDRFIVLWKTEENTLLETIQKHLEGRNVQVRQDKREPLGHNALLTPSFLTPGSMNSDFRPILAGSFENISNQGSCLKIQAPFYGNKEFVNLSFQNKEGEYVSVHGQVRWSRWNEQEHIQELGIHFVTS